MAVYRFQCSFTRDTTFARDRLMLTPHFDVGGLGPPDIQALAEDLATGLDAWDAGLGQLDVVAYDAQGTPPVYPVADATRNVGLAPAATGVREVAVCLSYFSGVNRARRRGRLYIPATLGGISTTATRPSPANRQKVADLVPLFTNLGGTNVDWCVYSKVDNVARPVTNWWVDDAWDIQRSRGLAPTTRLEGTTSEA